MVFAGAGGLPVAAVPAAAGYYRANRGICSVKGAGSGRLRARCFWPAHARAQLFVECLYLRALIAFHRLKVCRVEKIIELDHQLADFRQRGRFLLRQPFGLCL